MRFLPLACLLALALFGSAGAAHADEVVAYDHGFAALSEALAGEMGDPITPEHPSEDGSGYVVQVTTTGLAYWREGEAPAWTNGWARAALTDDRGLVRWEGEAMAPPAPPPLRATLSPRAYLYAAYPDVAARLDCIYTKESQWQMVWNRQGSGAYGVGQYMRGTFVGHVRYYSSLPPDHPAYLPPTHSWHDPYHQVDVGARDLRRGMRSQWAVGGC